MNRILNKIRDKFTRKQPNPNVEESVFLIGPAGTGKSTISGEIARKMEAQGKKMPVITLDLMRHCPRDKEFIKRRVKGEEARIRELEAELARLSNNPEATEEDRAICTTQLEMARGEYWKWSRRQEIRTLMPDLPCYEDLGWSQTLSEWLEKNAANHGINPKIAWHFYEKYYENKLMEETIRQLPCPCVVDTGGGVPVVLEKDYEIIYKKALELGRTKTEIKSAFPRTPAELAEDSREIFEGLPETSVVYLQLPKNYKEHFTRAAEDVLNSSFIGTGQYEEKAGITIDASPLFTNKQFNPEAKGEIASTIIERTGLVQGAAQ